MRWLSILIPLLVACGSSSPAEPSDTGTDAGTDIAADGPSAAQRTFDDLVAYAETYATDKGIPGLSIAVVLDGKLAFSTGVGVKADGGADRVGTHTRFRVASMTKMIVATGVMQLVEQGKLSLDDTLESRLPWMKLQPGFDAKTVKLSQLLSHTAGFPDGLGVTCDVGAGALEKYYAADGPYPLWSPPGRLWNYSNHHYAMAAGMIEAATGKVFTDVLATSVLGPLGMREATFEPKVAAAGDHVQGHQKGTKPGVLRAVPIDRWDCASLRAAGGLYATAEDYAHLAEVFLDGGGTVLSKASVAAMTAPHANLGQGPDTNYGFGLFGFDWKGLSVVSHDGGLPGFLSTVMWVPAKKMAVVVLANADVASVEPVALRAIDAFLSPTGEAKTYRTDPSTWTRYAGTYDDPFATLGATKVTLTGGKLGLAYGPSELPVDLVQASADSFVGDFVALGTKLGVTFFADPSGAVEYVVTRVGVARRTAAGFATVPSKKLARIELVGPPSPVPRMDALLLHD